MSLLDSITEPRPQIPSLGTAVRLLNDALGNRFDLASVELEESRDAAAVAAVLIAVVLCLVISACFAFTLTIAAVVWDSPHRGAWLGGLAGAYLVVGGIIGFVLWRRLRAWQPFAETKSQIKQDYQCLQELSKAILH